MTDEELAEYIGAEASELLESPKRSRGATKH